MKIAHTIKIFVLLALAGCSEPGSLEVGSGANDMILVKEANRSTLVVAASMDSAIQFYDVTFSVTSKVPSSAVFFPPNALGPSANPWALSISADNKSVFSTLYGNHALAQIDLESRTLKKIVYPMLDFLKHPTALTVLGNNIFVVFTNFRKWDGDPGIPADFGAGALAHFTLNNNELSFVNAIELPCKNPSDIKIDPLNRPVVVCGGSLKSLAGDLFLDHGAALIVLDPILTNATLRVQSLIPLTFSGSKLIIANDGYFLLGNTTRQILFLPINASSLENHSILSVNPNIPQESGYLSGFTYWSDQIVLIADYRKDQLVALDLASKSLNPFPFCEPIRLTKNDSSIFRGPIALTRNNQTDKRSSGEFLVLMGLSSEVITITPAKDTTCP